MADKVHTDEQYIMLVRNNRSITIREVAEKLKMSVRNTSTRLHKLVDEGKLVADRIGVKWHFSLPEDN